MVLILEASSTYLSRKHLFGLIRHDVHTTACLVSGTSISRMFLTHTVAGGTGSHHLETGPPCNSMGISYHILKEGCGKARRGPGKTKKGVGTLF